MIMGQVLANHVAPLDDYEPVHTDFSYEDMLTIEEVEEYPKPFWKMYFDGP